ncbi:hypothetical protein [Halovenus halobia]|uniref:hypothetical protein n=1 Tax=Halovenus halobia TaxID=3396622 RepID=UPI003F562987
MASDLGNMLRMMNILGDEGFVDALENAERLVDSADRTLERVEKIESDAEQAVREANETLTAVDNRLATFDETISLLEAKIEAGFSIGFFFFGLNRYLAGELFLAVALFGMGLLGASSLVVTIVTLPQVRRLRKMGLTAWRHVDDDDGDETDDQSSSEATELNTDGGRRTTPNSASQSDADRDTASSRRRRAGRYGRHRE